MHSLGDIEDVKHLINVNSFDYISLREMAIDSGVEAYNIKIYSNGKIEDFTNKNKYKKKKLDWDIIKKLSKEVKDFNFRNFQLKNCEFFMTYQPSFKIEVKYADGYSNEVYYDYGSNYENTSGDNKIDILDLKSNVEKILKLKSLSDIFR